MATQTSYLGLTKPDGNEYYNVEVNNANLDEIDAELETQATAASSTDGTIWADAIIFASSWESGLQAVSVLGLLGSDVRPQIHVLYEGTLTAEAEQERSDAFAKIRSLATTADGSITFTLWDDQDAPAVDIPIGIEIRRGYARQAE